MVSRKVKCGSIGVNVNHTHEAVLLQATDECNQARIVLTPEEAHRWGLELIKRACEVQEYQAQHPQSNVPE